MQKFLVGLYKILLFFFENYNPKKALSYVYKENATRIGEEVRKMKKPIIKKRTNNSNMDEFNKKKDLYLEGIRDFKKIDKDSINEIDKAIKYMIDEINEKFTYEKCLDITGNQRNITDNLYKLLKGSGYNGISVDSLAKNYLYYKSGKYDAYEFMCDIEGLLDSIICEFADLEVIETLACEFADLEEWLFTGKITRSEVKNYEIS